MLNFTRCSPRSGALIGFSKAGFGGGLGILTTPIACSPQRSGKPPGFAVGVLLPLLCAGRAFFDLLLLGKVGAQEPEIPCRESWRSDRLESISSENFPTASLNIPMACWPLSCSFSVDQERIYRARAHLSTQRPVSPSASVRGLPHFRAWAGPLVSMFPIAKAE